MTTAYSRDRTLLFLSFRESVLRPTPSNSSAYPPPSSNKGKGRAYDDDEEESTSLIRGMEETIVDFDGVRSQAPPRWLALAQNVEQIIAKLPPKISQLDKLHSKHLLPAFTDRTVEEREIHLLTTQITTDFRRTQQLIRQIADMSKALLSSSKVSEARKLDLIMAANVQTALATKVQEVSSVFRKKQKAYFDQLNAYEGRNQKSLGAFKDPLATTYADDNPYAEEALLQQSQLADPDTALLNRSNEISAIAQSITDLSGLFKDLSSLVIDQGTLLDRVDYNVEQMGVEVKGAVEELKTATHYQKRSGKCQIIFLLLLLIAGAIILILYRPIRQSQPKDTVTPFLDADQPHQVGSGLGMDGLEPFEGATEGDGAMRLGKRFVERSRREVDRRGSGGVEGRRNMGYRRWPFRRESSRD